MGFSTDTDSWPLGYVLGCFRSFTFIQVKMSVFVHAQGVILADIRPKYEV